MGLTADSFEAFCSNLWLLPVLHAMVENVDNCIFALSGEETKLMDFFGGSKNCEDHMARIVNQSMCPFPRLHFFMLSNALGQELQDGDIVTPCVSLGAPSGIPLEKFSPARSKWSPLCLSDDKNVSKVERVVPADGGCSGCLIQPGLLFQKMLTSLNEKAGESLTWKHPDLGGDDYAGELEDTELEEAQGNLSDLLCEYQQYGSVCKDYQALE